MANVESDIKPQFNHTTVLQTHQNNRNIPNNNTTEKTIANKHLQARHMRHMTTRVRQAVDVDAVRFGQLFIGGRTTLCTLEEQMVNVGLRKSEFGLKIV